MKSFFISSTFKDMQAERDAIHQQVFPFLRKKIKDYGEDIQELDLRWGVDTSLISEEENGHYIIGSCIDAIDRCNPYMIVLLGDRYGWIPEQEVVQNLHDERIERWYQEPISITQMEILYGAFEQKNLEHCIFCFRENGFVENVPDDKRWTYQAESTEYENRLKALKEKIRAREDALILEYQPIWDEQTGKVGGLGGFLEQLGEMLWKMILKDIGESTSLSIEEKILNNAALTAKRHWDSYVQRGDMLTGMVLSGIGAFWYHGVTGCGKSAFLSNIYQGAINIGSHAFIYYCGNENCQSLETLLETLLFWLKKESGEKDAVDMNSLTKRQKMESILHLLKDVRRWDSAIIIDGVECLEDDAVEALGTLAQAVIREKASSAAFAFIVSSSEEFYERQYKKIKLANFSGKEIKGLDSTEVIAFTQTTAKRRGKHLDARTQNAIRRKKHANNPYYLSLVLQKLFMMDEDDFREADAMGAGIDGLAAFMEKMIQEMPEEPEELTLDLIRESANKLNGSIWALDKFLNLAEPMLIFQLIAVSRNGLSMSELKEILQKMGKTLLPLAMQKIFDYLYDFFGESETGRIDYVSHFVKETVLAKIQEEQLQKFNLLLCQTMQEKGEFAESFSYALASKDTSALKACMEDAEKCDKKALGIYFTGYERSGMQRDNLHELLSSSASAEHYGWFLAQVVLNNRDRALKDYSYWLEKLVWARNRCEISQRALSEILRAEQLLRKQGDQELTAAQREKIEPSENEKRIVQAKEHVAAGDYQAALVIVKDLIPWYTQRMLMFPSVDERMEYVNLVYFMFRFVKPGYALKYIPKIRKQLEILVEDYPLVRFKRELAYSYYMEAYKLEQLEAQEEPWDEDHAITITDAVWERLDRPKKILEAYGEAIRIYEETISRNREDMQNLKSLDMLVYLRRKRMQLRNQGDIWKWSAERSSTSRISISEFCKKIEKDLETLIEDAEILYKIEDGAARLEELVWSYYEGMNYFDLHQEEEKMVQYSRLLLKYVEELELQKDRRQNLNRIFFYSVSAECYEHFERTKEAESLAKKCLKMIEELDPVWIKEKKAEKNVKWYLVKCYLVTMKCQVLKGPETVLEYFYPAWRIAETDLTAKADEVLKSDLKQALAESYFYAGNEAEAVILLKETQQYWSEAKISRNPEDELKQQKRIRFLNGQALLGCIQKDFKLLEQVIKYYKGVIEDRTPNADASCRPLLLKQAKKLERFYKEELVNASIPPNLEYILLGNEAARKRKNWEDALKKEEACLQDIRNWELLMNDLTHSNYLKLLKKAVELQDKMSDLVPKKSQEYIDLYVRKIKITKKITEFYWNTENVRYAVNYESFLCAQFECRKEVMEQLFSAEECWNHWGFLKGKRDSLPYVKRVVEAEWANLSEGAIKICYRYYDETKDTKWLWQAAEEAVDYRSYIKTRFEHSEDYNWNMERLDNFYAWEQDVYLRLQKDGRVEEKSWLGAFLSSLNEQLELDGSHRIDPEEFYKEKIAALYVLQESGIEDTKEVRKVIDKITEKQGKTGQTIGFYMQKAARALGPDADLTQLEAYVKKLMEEERNS